MIKLIKYENQLLYCKYDKFVTLLGNINTKKGKLTKSQKLKAVQLEGQWVEI